MRNSESATQIYTLADLPTDVPARIVAVDPEERASLAALGVRVGSVVSIDGDAPLGGPRIVCLGRARLAVARSVARLIRVRPEPGPNGTGQR